MLRPLALALVSLALVFAGCIGGQPVQTSSNGDGSSVSAGPDGACATSGNSSTCASPGGASATSGNTTASASGGNATATAGSTTVRAAPPVSLSVGTAGQYPVNPAFEPATLSAPRGAMLNVTFTNAEQLPLFAHNWVLEGVDGAETEAIDAGASTSVTFRGPLSAGDYAYFCSIGDHRDRGMEGVLTIA